MATRWARPPRSACRASRSSARSRPRRWGTSPRTRRTVLAPRPAPWTKALRARVNPSLRGRWHGARVVVDQGGTPCRDSGAKLDQRRLVLSCPGADGAGPADERPGRVGDSCDQTEPESVCAEIEVLEPPARIFREDRRCIHDLVGGTASCRRSFGRTLNDFRDLPQVLCLCCALTILGIVRPSRLRVSGVH